MWAKQPIIFTAFAMLQALQGFSRGRPPVVNTPPFQSVEELMQGKLIYVVGVPDTPDAALTIQVFKILALLCLFSCCHVSLFSMSCFFSFWKGVGMKGRVRVFIKLCLFPLLLLGGKGGS